jgi:uroporphyrinogen-III synthase
MTMPCDLGGRGVLVTRPRAQAAELSALIQSVGGRPILFPTLEILPPVDADLPRSLLTRPWDIIIFISRNAVAGARDLAPDLQWLAGAQVAAVGKSTAKALQRLGHAPDLVPDERYDSESLLELPPLREVSGKRVLIVRGVGGRAHLGDTLSARGAAVAYAEVYRRVRPQVDAGLLMEDWHQSLGFVTATSDEVLSNLLGMIPDAEQPWLKTLPLVVFSERGAGSAMELGFRVVAVAKAASDEAMVEALCRLHLNRPIPRR